MHDTENPQAGASRPQDGHGAPPWEQQRPYAGGDPRPYAGDQPTSEYPPGYPPPGYPPPGYHQHGYSAPGYDQPGYSPPGHPPGYRSPGYPPPRRRGPALVAIAIAVVLLVVVGTGVARVAWRTASRLAGGASAGSGTSGSSASSGSSAAGGATADASSVAAKVDPGVVDIDVTLGFAGAQAAGTGMVLTSSGIVLTNNHVISGATRISATDVGDGRTYAATVVGYDRTGDLAVLQLTGAHGLHTVSIGRSSAVSVGDAVVAIGNAGGVGGTPSAAPGTVSALGQSIVASDRSDGTSEQLTGLIQVAANVQAGDSGGPLADSRGQVVGVDTAATSGFRFQYAQGAGYAIPIDTAMAVARQIRAGNSSDTVHIGRTGFLGVEVSSTGGDTGGPDGGAGGGSGGSGQSGSGGSGQSGSGGAVVAAVVSGSPAEQAGLAEGDTIIALDGQAVDTPTTLTALKDRHHPGDTVRLRWVDQTGNQHEVGVRLAAGPPD